MNKFIYTCIILLLIITAFIGGFYMGKIFFSASQNAKVDGPKFVESNPFSLNLPISASDASISTMTLTYTVKGSILNVSDSNKNRIVEIADLSGKKLGSFKVTPDTVVFQVENNQMVRKDVTILKNGQSISNTNIYYSMSAGKIKDSYISTIFVK